MSFQIIRNDITKVKADAIVNTANPKPTYAGGTDRAVYKAAGEQELLAERKKIGDIAPGQAAVTPAFGLQAKYIIHTVGPEWVDGKHGEKDVLRSCYANSLALADELKVESIAFPLIATGVYGFPKDEALNIAMAEIGKFLLVHEMLVTLVVFDMDSFQLSSNLVKDIDEFIDAHGVNVAWEKEYGSEFQRRNMDRFAEISFTNNRMEMPRRFSYIDFVDKDLDAILGSDRTGETFQEKLFKLIDDRRMSDSQVYTKAEVSRKVFSSIRCNKDYKPSKRTAVALSIALELDMSTMLELLASAEIAFSRSSVFDLIITYFVEHKIYDTGKIDTALFKYGEETLWSEK